MFGYESFVRFVRDYLGDIVVEGFDSPKIRSYWYVWANAECVSRFDDMLCELEEFGLHPACYDYQTTAGLETFSVDRTKQFRLLYEESRRIKNLPV